MLLVVVLLLLMTTLGRAATFLLLANTDEEEEDALRYEVLGNDDAEQQRMEDIFTFCARLRCALLRV